MNFLIACGGTSGHINPAIAIADELKKRFPRCQILFIGTENKLEADLVPRAGYEIKFIEISGISRRKNFAGLKHNISTFYKFVKAKANVKKIIDEFKPDVAIGTGGYVSAPVMQAACEKGIKTVIHEQNAFAGVTTKILSRKVDKILLSYPLAKPLKDCEEKIKLVGNPVRNAFLEINREKARESLGISADEKVVLSCGGSLGAKKLNEAFCVFAEKMNEDGTALLYHGASRDYKEVKEKLSFLKEDSKIKVFEYIYNMPELMAASDLIISRSGATSLTEISALGRASILIPSPNVTENHQYFNARTFSDIGAAILLEEKDLSGESLYESVNSVLFDSGKLSQMEKAAKTLFNKNAINDIGDTIVSLIK